MKKTLFLLCLLSTTAAFAQYASLSAQPHVTQFESHPEHASYASLAQEQSVLGGASYTSAQGERPVLDFPQPAAAVSLGAYAREVRQQHAQLKKSRVVWVNQ